MSIEEFVAMVRLNVDKETWMSDLFLPHPARIDTETGRAHYAERWHLYGPRGEYLELILDTGGLATVLYDNGKVGTFQWRHTSDRTTCTWLYMGRTWVLEYWTPQAPGSSTPDRLEHLEERLRGIDGELARLVEAFSRLNRYVLGDESRAPWVVEKTVTHAVAGDMEAIADLAARQIHGAIARHLNGETFDAELVMPDDTEVAGTPPEVMVTVCGRSYILTIAPETDETGSSQ